MDLLNALYNLVGPVFVLGTLISMGLSLTMKQIALPLRIDWPEGAVLDGTWTPPPVRKA
jgi:hypothetical protein